MARLQKTSLEASVYFGITEAGTFPPYRKMSGRPCKILDRHPEGGKEGRKEGR